MKIVHSENGTELTVAPEGRLDTATAPELEEDLKKSLPGVTALTLDFENRAT